MPAPARPQRRSLHHLATGRQRAALFRDPLDVTAKLDLLDQQRLAGTTIFGALIGKAKAGGPREFGGGFQSDGLVHG
jgi:hypothetical protein